MVWLQEPTYHQVERNETGSAWALLAGVVMCTEFLWGNLVGDQLGDLGLEDRIILTF